MSERRNFVKQIIAGAGALSLSAYLNPVLAAELDRQVKRVSLLNPDEAATDEEFWAVIRDAFTPSTEYINLNNGGVSPQPRVVQDAHIKHYKYCNEGPAYNMWHVLDKAREPLRKKLAELSGCSPEEIAINRNSTEGLNTVIFGLNLKAGDEVIMTKYDYPNMMNAWRQREKREGIKLVWLDFDLPVENDKIFYAAFEKAITPRTKIIHITHMINWTGQIMPVKQLCDLAHSKGIEVIVDGAHTFAHMDFKITDFGCDYFAASLHKWLCAPFGSGLLYIKKEKIRNIWALLSNDKPEGDDIRKFESLGTRSFASEHAISNAVDFHNLIGSKRKETRLRFLKDYWAKKLIKNPKIKLGTSLLPQWSCALAIVSVAGWDAVDIASTLMEKFKIYTVGIKHEKLNGIRVTPHVYTTIAELDKFVDAMTWIASNPSPGKK